MQCESLRLHAFRFNAAYLEVFREAALAECGTQLQFLSLPADLSQTPLLSKREDPVNLLAVDGPVKSLAVKSNT